MEIILSKEMKWKVKALAIYQIFGGLSGLALCFWLIAKLTTISVLILLILLIPIGLYAYSVYCGILLLKNNSAGLKHSLINQILQVINFSILGFSFQYISGVYISLGIDITDSFIFRLNFGVSTWLISINDGTKSLFVNFNFVALLLVLLIEKLKKKISKHEFEKRIDLIGK